MRPPRRAIPLTLCKKLPIHPTDEKKYTLLVSREAIRLGMGLAISVARMGGIRGVPRPNDRAAIADQSIREHCRIHWCSDFGRWSSNHNLLSEGRTPQVALGSFRRQEELTRNY